MTSPQAFQRAADVRALIEVLVRKCEAYLHDARIPGEPCKIHFHADYNLPCCIFRGPNNLSIDLRRSCSMGNQEIRDALLDCMASCALHREYMNQVEAQRTSIKASTTDKPYLAGFRSARWNAVRNQLAKL